MKTRVGHYEIVSELGRGGMGVVYKGYEPALTRYVAIKELAPSLAHDTMLVERFLREARSMAALNDPHIIQIYFIGQENEQPFFVMEFVDGESLSGLIKREGRLPVGDALKILHQSAKGLSVAHDRGVIHRDIKPANLMLSQRGQVKIADFGIALANHDFNSKLTGTGEFVGTPGYLSPEVCLGKAVDQRSDIFALGIVLFEMLTGRTPFSDESPLKLMLDVVQSEIPDVRELNTSVDADVATMLGKMLAKDPADRYQSTHELIGDLEKMPSVSMGGPLSIKTAAPSGPAATLIGLATPVTPGVGMRAPTPPPSVSSQAPIAPVSSIAAPAVATVAPGTPTLPGATQIPVAPAKKSRAPLFAALAVIALLLVGGVGYGAYSVYKKVSSATIAATDATASGAGDVAVVPATTGTPSSPTSDATISDTASTAPATDAPATTADSPTAAVETPTPPAPPATAEPATAPWGQDTAPTTATRPRPVRDAIASRVGERQAAAAADEPANTGAARTFAVETSGDPALMIPAEQAINEQFENAGLRLVDNARRADVVVRVRAEMIGTQELQFYGQSAAVTTAYLIVRPYRSGRPVGSGFRQKLDYTTLNAEDKVQQAMDGKLGGMVSSVTGQ